MKDIVLVSGGFDPIHSGHIYLIEEASKHGDVVVLLNSDNWLREKKGKEFLPFDERKIIMSALNKVIDVINFEESMDISGIAQGIAKKTNDHKEGVSAFLQKRKPSFNGD